MAYFTTRGKKEKGIRSYLAMGGGGVEEGEIKYANLGPDERAGVVSLATDKDLSVDLRMGGALFCESGYSIYIPLAPQ